MTFSEKTIEQEINLAAFLPEAKARLWIKRDDLIHPFISGNKWRKLEGIIRIAREKGVKKIETYGGAFSNHLLATACAGAVFGFQTTGFVRGEKVKNHVLLLCSQFGMELLFVGREKMREIRQQNVQLSFRGDTLIVPEGGNCPEAWYGCEKIIRETGDKYDEIWVATGTGTTVTGMARATSPGRLHGVMAVKDISLGLSLAAAGIHVHHGYEYGGYAKATPELYREMEDFTRNTGILLDPVYTGKLWVAVKERVRQPEAAKRKILMIHSGGLTGWLSASALNRTD